MLSRAKSIFAVGLAVATTSVLASGSGPTPNANAPVFSSNDDYDEVNLNIRLLQAKSKNTTSSTVTASFVASFSFPDGTTVEGLNKDEPFKTALAKGIVAALKIIENTQMKSYGVKEDTVSITKIEGAPDDRRKRALKTGGNGNASKNMNKKRQLAVALDLKVTYEVALESVDAATDLSAMVNDMSSDGYGLFFEGLLKEAIENQLQFAGLDYTISALESVGASNDGSKPGENGHDDHDHTGHDHANDDGAAAPAPAAAASSSGAVAGSKASGLLSAAVLVAVAAFSAFC